MVDHPQHHDDLFVAVSSFVVRNDCDDAVAAAFRNRPHLVDTADGFVRMEVLRGGADDKEFWLLTYWRDEASFDRWHGSHAHSDSHQDIPSGLKLIKGSAALRRFVRICE